MTYEKPVIIAQEKEPRAYVASCYQPTGMKCCECTHG
jgi:hypothetical protein